MVDSEKFHCRKPSGFGCKSTGEVDRILGKFVEESQHGAADGFYGGGDPRDGAGNLWQRTDDYCQHQEGTTPFVSSLSAIAGFERYPIRDHHLHRLFVAVQQ